MNPDNFGLNRPPFRSLSAYPGPQQLTLAGGLRRCLIAPDSVLVVTGPVGTGKTVGVRHALDRLDGDTLVARIRRTHVDRHELLEQLLDEFGVDPRPESSLKRLNALHEVFRGPGHQRQVFIIVEDAERLGADVLAELESLTAADQDDSPGAHLILLGPPTLEAFLEDPLLLRLNQRIRRRTELLPFSASETRGYIEHCLREAGGTPGEIIDDDAVAVVHDCSGGVARLVNAIAEALLFAASERGVTRIDRRFALRVAREDFGYIVSDDEVDEETGIVDDAAAPEVAQVPRPAANVAAEATADSAGDATQESATKEPQLAEPPSIDRTSPAEGADRGQARAVGDAIGPQGTDVAASQPRPAPASTADAARDESARVGDATGESTPAPAEEVRPEPAPEPSSAPDDAAATRAEQSDRMTDAVDAAAPVKAPKAAPRAESNGAAEADSTADADDNIEDTQPALSAISGIPPIPDHSATDTALGALKNATAPAARKRPESHDTAGDSENSTLEPASPQPMSKADDPADSQTIRALDDALRPDTQLLQTLDDAEGAPAEEPAPMQTDTVATVTAEAAAPEPPPRPEADTSMTGSMPTLSEDLIADALAEPDGGPQASTTSALPSIEADAPAGPGSADDVTAGGGDDTDLPMLSLEETGNTAAPDIGPGEVGGQESAPRDDTTDSVRPAGDEADDNLLMPEITLDNALEVHQQEQQAKLDEAQAAQDAAAPSGGGEDSADDEGEEQKRRLETLAARFSQAKSLEDVMDDTAAETLFGEEFSAMAAAVTNMHKALGDTPDGQEDVAEAANSGAFVEATEASPAVAESPATESRPADSTTASQPAATAAAGPAAPASGKGAAPRPPVPPRTDVDSSAMRRLEMVRALNKKAGKTPPPKPPLASGAPEEIVLGADNPAAGNGGAAPEPIENQFGPSMTNTLRQLSAENIRKMQEAEEAEEARKSAKKGGLLSRFRRG